MKTTITRLITISSICLAASSMSFADDQEKKISIFVNKTNDQNAVIDLKVDDDNTVFDLPDLQEGESRSFTTKGGKTVTITKENGQYIINAGEGKVITLPNVSGDELSARIQSFGGIDQQLESKNQITIIAQGLTEGQKQTIKDSILAAGVVKPVKFIEQQNKFFFISSGNAEFDTEVEFENSEGLSDEQIQVLKEIDVEKVEKIIIKKKDN